MNGKMELLTWLDNPSSQLLSTQILLLEISNSCCLSKCASSLPTIERPNRIIPDSSFLLTCSAFSFNSLGSCQKHRFRLLKYICLPFIQIPLQIEAKADAFRFIGLLKQLECTIQFATSFHIFMCEVFLTLCLWKQTLCHTVTQTCDEERDQRLP